LDIKIICGIYKITNPKGAIYIGQSKNIEKRIVYYRNYICESQPKLYNSLKAWGFENHFIEIIEECIEEELNCRERHWQDFYNVLDREKGLNCTLISCGELPNVYSDYTKANMKKSSPDYNGENNPFFGRRHSQKTKDMWKGKRDGVNSPLFGTKKTEQQKQAIRESQTGRIKSESTLKLLSIASSGHNNPKAEKVICTETMNIWNCVKYCADEIGMNHAYLCNYLSGRVINNTTYMFLKDYEKGVINLPFSNKTELIIDMETGIYYYSYIEAAKFYDLKPRYLLKILRGELPNKTNLILC